MNLFSFTDLTLLDMEASSNTIQQLVNDAQKHQVAAVCVYPKHLSHIPKTLSRATVLNFPSGETPHHEVMKALEQMIKDDLADEIDYVFPYQSYLANLQSDALAKCQEIYQCCFAGKRKLKVIIETGALSYNVIHTLSLQLIDQGCDFIKTSTGKIAIGATPEAAKAILSAIKTRNQPCGIKISGGIRNRAQVLGYVDLAETMLKKAVDASWFRVGSSVLIS